MDSVDFTVLGPPQGKGRARSAVLKNGNTVHYTPSNTRTYELVIATVAADSMRGRELMEGPLHLHINAYFEVPHSWPKWKAREALLGNILPTVKPDLDNIEKAVKDALNGVVWRDDTQVTSCLKFKTYSDRPRVAVSVTPVDAMAAQVKRKEAS